MDPIHLFLAAVRAVAPHALRTPRGPSAPASGAQLVAWVAETEPSVRPILAQLTQTEREDLERVLDGMLRERALLGTTTGRPRT